jgi:hypothetical protein
VCTDQSTGAQAFATLNEGLGKVLRFGANSPEVLDRLRWLGAVVGPTLNALLSALDGGAGLDTQQIMAQALHMGDEVHNRNTAATGQLLKQLVGGLSGVSSALMSSSALADTLRFLAGNDHSFLNMSMATCKLMMDAAAGVSGSTIVTAMARNGVQVGIRMSGTGDQWFKAEASVVDGLYFPGFGPEDAARDLGDSAITETAGFGGFAMAAAPAIVGFVGGTTADALATTERMRAIVAGRNPKFTLPSLGFSAIPFGIDARLVVDTGILPVINTGIAHRSAGVGQIGAGVTTAPAGCFVDAVLAFAAGRDSAACVG